MSTNEISPIIPIENKKFLCVEYPGYVRNTQRAIKTLGGENTLADAIANDLTVTINYRPGVTFTHPTTGCVLPSSKLLVKVTRRVKKNKTTGEIEAEDPNTPWKTEVVGTIPKTLRFRALADFQYHVPKDDRIRQLKESLQKGDVDKIVDFKMSMDDDDFDNLRGIPPPVFTNHETVFAYGYRQNSQVVRVRVKQPDGSYNIKLFNRNNNAGLRVTIIHFDEENVPNRPWHNLEPAQSPLEEEAVQVVRSFFEERPVWTRLAMKNLLDLKYHRYLKKALIASAYTFQSGPWRECWVKYGIDPRKDQKFNIYQQVDIRKNFNMRVKTNFIKARKYKPVLNVERKEDEKEQSEESEHHKDGHIFNGLTFTSETTVFQLCDIVDPDIMPLINNPKYLKAEATRFSGFYYRCVLVRIRAICRRKLTSIEEKKPCPVLNVEKGLEEEIAKEIESKRKEDEGYEGFIEGDTSAFAIRAEQAAKEAKEISNKNDSKRLKDVVDDYMVQLQKVIKRGGEDRANHDEDDEIDLEAIDGLDDYDEEFDAIENDDEVLEEITAVNESMEVSDIQEEDVKMEETTTNGDTEAAHIKEEDIKMEEA